MIKNIQGSLHMRVVLFHIGNYAVHSYGIIVVLAVLLGMGVGIYFAKQEGKYSEHISNLTMYALVGAVIGARFWQVFFFEWSYYSHHLGEIIQIWQGGLSIQGGLVGGLLVAIWYTRKHKINFWELADILAPAIILAQGIGRIACLLNGDAFGSPTGNNYGLVYPPGTAAYSEYGSKPLFPAEVWEGQLDVVTFALLLIIKQRKLPTGILFLIYNVLYNAERFGLEFLRGDSPRTYGLTAAQWTGISVFVLCILFSIFLLYKDKQKKHADITINA
jgi:phosphatidylglycerol:prolipoprotein diacylglycerol transferase